MKISLISLISDAVSLALVIIGLLAFATHNVADAIFAVSFAIWVKIE